jgi:hypothetical protein
LTDETFSEHQQFTPAYWAMVWGTGAMAQQVCVVLSTTERELLAAIAGDRYRPRKHVERARIVLASADRLSAQRVHKAPTRLGRGRDAVSRYWRIVGRGLLLHRPEHRVSRHFSFSQCCPA